MTAAPKTATPRTPLAPNLADIDFRTVSVRPVIITPAVAEQYLTVAGGQRQLSSKSLARLVTDIRAHKTFFTADTIKFDINGKLIDGLVRLSAIIKTNRKMKVLLATGVAPEARHVIDTGTIFTLQQSLELEGVKHAGHVAAALKSIQAWERGDHLAEPDPFRGATTNPTSLSFLAEHPEVEQIALEAAKLSKKLPSLTTKQIAAFIWMFDQLDREARTDFFAKLLSGANTGATDPIYLLHELLIRNENAVHQISTRTLNALTIKAWNAYRDGRQMKVLTFTNGGSHPDDFPLPR